jgi:membrane protease YdiL (CAAX protease family)
VRQALQTLLSDVLELFDDQHAYAWFVLVTSALCLSSFWALARAAMHPIPITGGFLPGTFVQLGWALLFLLAVPAVAARLARLEQPTVGFRQTLSPFAWRASLALSLAALGLALFTPLFGPTLLQLGWVGPQPPLLFWLALLAAYAFAFEFFFRGFLLQGLAQAWGRTQALWFQAFATTSLSLGGPVTEAFAIFAFSLLLGVLTLRSRALVWPWLVQLAWLLGRDARFLGFWGGA